MLGQVDEEVVAALRAASRSSAALGAQPGATSPALFHARSIVCRRGDRRMVREHRRGLARRRARRSRRAAQRALERREHRRGEQHVAVVPQLRDQRAANAPSGTAAGAGRHGTATIANFARAPAARRASALTRGARRAPGDPPRSGTIRRLVRPTSFRRLPAMPLDAVSPAVKAQILAEALPYIRRFHDQHDRREVRRQRDDRGAPQGRLRARRRDAEARRHEPGRSCTAAARRSATC